MRMTIGYWREKKDPNSIKDIHARKLPWPEDFITDNWQVGEKEAILKRLSDYDGEEIYMGYSTCRICGCRNGDTEFYDNRFCWPEGLAHYVSEHNVKLLEFEEMMRET